MVWMRLGRAIKHGEQPIKTVKQRAVTARAKMQVEECEAQGKDAVSALFGEWQTELFRPPPVTNGKVPRNDYGRLDLFTESMLPEGATHIPHPDAKQLCKDLGIDCVEAVVRFEFRRGISTPIISGVVVPSDAAELLTDALAESTQNKVAQQRAAMERRAVKRWRRLLVALRVRKEVDDTFATRSSLPQGTTFKNKNKGKSIEIASSGTSSDEDEEDPIDTGGGFIL
ncbi:hypothetical protein FBU59_004272 [Linderina macrospora]|uniref:Uncharacterized protein n=1 Tax=Linderina macrospora TaxID=4868 RepID=A0ACC1J653_9FUNG|nr:hypothetical protein FBU59_004272 [Linderina macrospora]